MSGLEGVGGEVETVHLAGIVAPPPKDTVGTPAQTPSRPEKEVQLSNGSQKIQVDTVRTCKGNKRAKKGRKRERASLPVVCPFFVIVSRIRSRAVLA